MDPERPMTDWEARVARAKADGTWYAPDEEPSPYPPRVKWLRFWRGFAIGLVAAQLLGAVLHILDGRPGSPFSGDALLDQLVPSVFVALYLGWLSTRPPRRKR